MRWYDKLVNGFKSLFNNSTPQIAVKLLVDDKKLFPTKSHWDDSGYDIRSAEKKVIRIEPGETVSINCGIAIELPIGYEAQVRPRSGLAYIHAVTVLNTPGTIDTGYRGEIKVILTNFGKGEFKVHYGDRIAQLVIQKVPDVIMIQTDKLKPSGRGEAGLGSTGHQ